MKDKNVNARSFRRKFYLARKNMAGLAELLYLRLSGAYSADLSVAICTTVKDRFDHLEQTFLRNIQDNASYSNCEFILLNYNCPDPRTEAWVKSTLMPYIESKRLTYYFFPDAPKYDFAHSQNMAFRLAKSDIVCNIGADNFIGKGFAAYVSASLRHEGVFLRGPVDGRGLGGKICVRRKDWERVGGYDERLKDWGWDDTDMSNRLGMIGVREKVVLPEKFCNILAHSDEMRVQHLSQSKEESDKTQGAIAMENVERGILRPNGDNFGHGRVLKNFSEWVEV